MQGISQHPVELLAFQERYYSAESINY